MRHRTIRLTAIAALLTAIHPAALRAECDHPFGIRDMLAMDRISDPQVSPDGTRVLFSLRSTDMEANRGRTDLHLIDLTGENHVRLTSHEAAEFNARWLSSSEVVFLSTRSGSAQVWRISTDGGEAVQVTDEPLSLSSLAVSRDGSRIAYSMDVFPGMSPAETKAKLDEIEARKSTGRVYDQLFIRHWDFWKDGRRSHVFVRDIEGGEAIDVMKSMDADCPSKPFGGPGEYTLSADGRTVWFAARDAGREEAWSTNFDIYSAPSDGARPPRNHTEPNKAWDTSPSLSPDGKWIAYASMSRPTYEADRFRVVLMPADPSDAGGPASGIRPDSHRVLTEDWDRSCGGVTWSRDGKSLYCSATNLGQHSLFSIDVATGKVRTLIKEGWIGAVDSAPGHVVYGMDNLKSPVELYSVSAGGGSPQRITRINDDRVAKACMGDYEQFTFSGWNDEEVYGYALKPANFDSSRKYPVAFLIHGGPQGSFGNHFHYRWNPQAYTGAGYAVVMIDFHGSTGYGQDFTDSIGDDWGGKPLEDLKKGLAAALKRYPWMNGDKVAALGASYGGYMINWIAGNWNDRFTCLVNHDGLFDLRMSYYDTEELWFPEWEHRGTPWTNPQAYEKHNPALHVDKWQTPMLVVHGALDFRVVETEGFATFTALQRRGVPSKLLYFPNENHWVLQPHNSIQWHNEVLSWLDKWTK